MLLGLIKTLRPRQWFKNVFVLAPIVFAKSVFEPSTLLRALAAFFTFSLLAGAIYTMNDIVDVEADRKHPTKMHRPIPAGVLPIPVARSAAVVLVIGSLVGAFLISPLVAVTALAYLLNNVLYSFRIKHVAWLDVASISAGFVLRVLAGCYAVSTADHPVRPSWYLLACTALLALFLGFGKRRHELKVNSSRARASLDGYTPQGLSVALWSLGTLTFVTYITYTLDRATREFFHSDQLWLTAPFAGFAIARFVQLVEDGERKESPTDEMLRDVPFVVTLVLYTLVVITIVYRLRPSP